MDGDNSKARPNRCWGATDLEEDVDAYNAYQIPKDKIDNTSINKTVGYNKTNEMLNPVAEKKKKSRGKGKQTVIPTNDETKRQLPSFGGSPDDLNGNVNKPNQETDAIQLPKHKLTEDPKNKIPEIENISSNFSTTSIYPQNSLPIRTVFTPRPANDINQNLYYGFNSRLNPYQMSYQNMMLPQRIYQQTNPLFPMANVPNFTLGNTAPRMINYQQQNITKATYYERLEVIDVLFRFIIQILRSPEQPSFEQIEDIKKMLDSLITRNNEGHLT